MEFDRPLRTYDSETWNARINQMSPGLGSGRTEVDCVHDVDYCCAVVSPPRAP